VATPDASQPLKSVRSRERWDTTSAFQPDHGTVAGAVGMAIGCLHTFLEALLSRGVIF
jgi:hypothetical protein